ncbi:MAG: T9SS type A sorting domain-containing protein [Bacteroidota bacterium]
MKRTIPFFFLLFSIMQITFAQEGYWMAKLEKNISSLSKSASVSIDTYTYESPRPSIVVDWGDGSQDTMQAIYGYIPNQPGMIRHIYSSGTSHVYSDFGEYVIQVRDSFWIGDIVNASNSAEEYLLFSDTIRIVDDLAFGTNSSPIYFFSPFVTMVDSNGVVTHETGGAWDVDLVEVELGHIPMEGYYIPEGVSTSFNLFTWDKPTQPGRYLFSFEATDYRQFTVEMSTTTYMMVIEVDSSMIVSNQDIWKQNFNWDIFPNPTSSNVTINLQGNLTKEKSTLTLTNLLGQSLQRIQLPHFDGVFTYDLEVSDYPVGTYFLTLQSGAQVMTRKVVIQR